MQTKRDNYERLLESILKLLENNTLDTEKLRIELGLHTGHINYLNRIKSLLFEKHYSKKDVKLFIRRINSLLLKYAHQKYNESLPFTGDDIMDSLIYSINFMGEELNYSTVTTHYAQDVFNSIANIIIVVDNLGLILFINKATTQKLGYKEKELKSQNINMLLEEGLDYKMLIESKSKRRFYNFFTKNNERIPVSLSISKFSRKDNPFMGHVIIARDVSMEIKFQNAIKEHNRKMKKTNEELKMALAKAEESEKLKSSFIANISHEIRTPLNGIMGFSELMQLDNCASEDYRKYGKIIIECGNHLLGIVNDVLDISKIEARLVEIMPERCDLNQIFDKLFAIYQQKIIQSGKKINFILSKGFPDYDCCIITDELRLNQVLSNLLDNAVKFTEKGQIEFGYYREGKWLHFFIKDTGIGIPDDKKEVIFKPFIQAAKSTTKLYGGTGLGLTIAHALIELMGGHITVKSETGEGTEFIFTLPYEKCSLEKGNHQHLFTFKTYDWRNKTIFLVEDDAFSSDLLKAMLLPTGANIITAVTGNDAVKIFRKNKRIDIALIDYKLPDIDGCEVARQIRNDDRYIPLIAQTAFATAEDKKHCMDAGFNFFIPKPVNRDLLLNMINNYLV